MRNSGTHPRFWISALGLVALGFCALGTASVALAADAPPKSASAAAAAYAKAKKLPGYAVYFAKGCYECHGYSGAGAQGVGAALTPNLLSIEQMRNYVRAPRGQMPPYSSKILSDQELGQIHDYLAAVPVPRPVEDVPLLKSVMPHA